MNFKEFQECFEKLRNNIDKFIKEIDDNDELIRNYLQIANEVNESLKKQYKEIEKFENSDVVKIWRFHLKENKKYGFSELAKEIETKIEEFDNKLKQLIQEKELNRDKILKANKKGI